MGELFSSSLILTGLSAGATAGVAVAAGVILTGLYLLKLQRRRVLVPFAPLWVPAGGERRSERLARRLRRWLSLLLQLIFVALVLLAAADPRSATAQRTGRSLLILVDRSASMSAKDEDGTRLGQARRVARALATGMGAADRAMIAAFAAGVTAESGFDTDAGRLGAAADGIAASEEPADLGRALTFAAAVLRGRPHPTLILVSDGAFSDDDRARAHVAARDDGGSLAGIDVRFARVGRRADNLALLSFAARRYPADPSSIEAAIVVQSYRDRPSDVVLEITAGRDARPVDRVRLHLGPHERKRHLLPDVAAPDALLEARLVDTGDDLAIDDRAYAVVPGIARWRILRIGDPDLFLEGALLSLGEGVEVHRRAARDLEASRDSWSRYDAVIFDGVTPAPTPTNGRFFYIDPHGAASPFPEHGRLREPIISDTRKGHALLRHLSLADVNIAEARRLALTPGDEAVVSSLGAPLIMTRHARLDAGTDLRVVALAFDLRRSDLPMRAAFPLLLANTLGWLGAPETIDPARLRTGHSVRLALSAGRAEAAVTDPTGVRRVIAAQAGAIDLPIARTGFYRIAPATTLAANLGDPIESNTAPAASLILGGRTLREPDPPASRHRRELWWWALVAAAALALGEWWSYHRRWTV